VYHSLLWPFRLKEADRRYTERDLLVELRELVTPGVKVSLLAVHSSKEFTGSSEVGQKHGTGIDGWSYSRTAGTDFCE